LTRRSGALLVASALLASLLASCGGTGDGAITASATEPPTAPATAAPVTAPSTTAPSTTAPSTTEAPTTAPSTTEAPTTAAPSTTTEGPDPDQVRDAATLRAYVAEAASFTQADAAWLLPHGIDPAAGGAPGMTRYVFRETSAGVVPTLVEGPIGRQVRCQDPDLPCSYLDLVALQTSVGAIPEALSLTTDELASLVDELDTLAAFAVRHAEPDAACAAGFVSDAIQTPNMGSHFHRARSFLDGFDPGAPEILIYAPSDGSLVNGPLGYCADGQWVGPDLSLVGTAFLLPPDVVGIEHPAGFTGDLDNWHSHFNLCRGNARGRDAFVTRAECVAAGGNWFDAIGWMLHAWVAPGFDSQLGVFSMWNPTIAPVVAPDVVRADRQIQGSDFPDGARQSLITNFAFDRTLVVDVGQSVYFNNVDSVPHTVSAGTPDDPDLASFDSGLLSPGDNWELPTSEAGTFSLFCALHPDMTATVVVG
jgi:hypothetical protein